jgi:hypothetical protein
VAKRSSGRVEEERAGFRGRAGPDSAQGPARANDWGDDWVHELIAMTRPGVEIEFPARTIDQREVPFVYDDFR